MFAQNMYSCFVILFWKNSNIIRISFGLSIEKYKTIRLFLFAGDTNYFTFVYFLCMFAIFIVFDLCCQRSGKNMFFFCTYGGFYV